MSETDLRASLTVTADASSVVAENRRAADSMRELKREAEATAEAMTRAANEQTRTADRLAAAPRPAAPASSAPVASDGSQERTVFEREQAEQAARAYRALEESLNPVIRAQREMERAQGAVNRAVAMGEVGQTEAAHTLAQLNSRYQEFLRTQDPAAQKAAAEARALEEERRAIQQLTLALDPAARAQHEFEQAQEQTTRAVRAGIITQEEATRVMALFEARQQGVGAGAAAMGGGLQNASYQMTDFIVQVQAGQSASLALAQQFPQMLGGLGAWGAVAGLAVAAGVPLISMFFGAEDAAGSLDDRLAKLETTLGSVSDNLDVLRDVKASETFGNMTGDVQSLTAELLKLDRAAELKTMRETLDALLKTNIDPSFWQKASLAIAQGQTSAYGGDALNEVNLSKDNYANFTGGRGPSYEAFQSSRAEIDAGAKAGDVEGTIKRVSALIREFTQGSPVTDLFKDLADMLVNLGNVASQTAEVEAQFNGTAQAAKLWASVSENGQAVWARVAEDGKVLKADGEERLRVAEQELQLAQVIALHGEQSREAEAERAAIARENYDVELERAGIYGEQRDRLLEIYDAHAAVSDATAAWADGMAAVRGEVEGILSAIASLGGGVVDRAAKAAELRALNAGGTIADAAKAGREARRDAEYNQRTAGGGIFDKAAAGVRRWWDKGNDQFEDDLSAARGEARKRERSTGGAGGRGGAGGGLSAAADVKREIAALKPSYENDVAAIEAWRDKAMAALGKSAAGYATYAADVETIFAGKMAKAYQADLARRDDWQAGIERGLLKMKDDMLSWADVAENIVTKWAEAGEAAFVSFATKGKAEMGDFVDFVAEQFARLAYQQMIQPGMDALMGWITQGIGGALGVNMGGGGSAVPTHHTGSPGVMTSYKMSGYGDTPRGNERLTMMRRGEEIMTSRALENAGALISAMTSLVAASAQPAMVDARPVIMPVNNSSVPLNMEVKETTDGRGQKQYQLALSDAVATGLRAPGGAARRTMANEYGLNRQGRNR